MQGVCMGQGTVFQFWFVYVVWLSLSVLTLCIHGNENTDAEETLRFGSGFPIHNIDTVHGFPDVKRFFEEYVFKSRPIKMEGAAKFSPAFRLWDDEYFLSLNLPEDSEEINVETKKKENRKQPTVSMSFQDFVKIYNDTDQYMVSSVPGFLREDIVIPGPLQCSAITEGYLVENLMWFSSGGTKSVVHTDSVDNINCLYRGEKELIMVDPALYGDKVDMDHPEGAYSGIDVDNVDLNKYPGLAEIEYYKVKLKAGDCLYIPFMWIHQVRSYGRNIAVNIWWNHEAAQEVDMAECNSEFNPSLTLDTANVLGFDSVMATPLVIKEHFTMFIRSKDKATLDQLYDFFLSNYDDMLLGAGEGYKIPIQEAYVIVDKDADGFMTTYDLKLMEKEDWDKVFEHMQNLESILHALEDKYFEMQDEHQQTFIDDRDEL